MPLRYTHYCTMPAPVKPIATEAHECHKFSSLLITPLERTYRQVGGVSQACVNTDPPPPPKKKPTQKPSSKHIKRIIHTFFHITLTLF